LSNNKTIFIKSINGDFSTNEVLDWIIDFGYNFRRTNEFDLTNWRFKFDLNKIENSFIYDKMDNPFIHAFWYRKGGKAGLNKNVDNNDAIKMFKWFENSEKKTIKEFFYKMFCKKGLNLPPANKVNKLLVLDRAKKIGLNIPRSIVTNDKNQVLEFIQKFRDVILKSISDYSIMYEKESKVFTSYTVKLKKSDLVDYPNLIFPILVQQEIKKIIDIRVFYLGGQCYPMAIFSQNDKQTNLDFRRYNFNKPNRQVPYNLSNKVKIQIVKLMKYFELESGSLDFILSKDNLVYFLEVNPVGQFGMVSYPCNYNLEKKIAQYLIKKLN